MVEPTGERSTSAISGDWQRAIAVFNHQQNTNECSSAAHRALNLVNIILPLSRPHKRIIIRA